MVNMMRFLINDKSFVEYDFKLQDISMREVEIFNFYGHSMLEQVRRSGMLVIMSWVEVMLLAYPMPMMVE